MIAISDSIKMYSTLRALSYHKSPIPLFLLSEEDQENFIEIEIQKGIIEEMFGGEFETKVLHLQSKM